LHKSEQDARVALAIGAGDSEKVGIARRFDREGDYACAVRRSAAPLAALVAAIEAHGGCARALGAGARKKDVCVGLVKQIELEVGPITVQVFNIGASVPHLIPEETARTNCRLTRGTPRGTCW
jgi:NAD(P)-dependent dehydrogenase (short-subunit alcohol dehydrogenase family)